TRSKRDWSSDVCSSDLLATPGQLARRALYGDPLRGPGDYPFAAAVPARRPAARSRVAQRRRRAQRPALAPARTATAGRAAGEDRSEERRVGKECRARWS